MNGWTTEGEALEGENVQAADGIIGELFDACHERFYTAREPWLKRAAEGDIIQKTYSTDTGIAAMVQRVVNDARYYIRSHDENGNELPIDYYKDNPVLVDDEPQPLKRWYTDGTYQRPNMAMAKIMSGDSSRTLFRRVLGSLPADWTDWADPAYSETLYNADQINVGDVIGAWTFDDMQSALNLTVWRPIPLLNYTPEEPYGYIESWERSATGRNYSSRQDAINLAIENYNNASPSNTSSTWDFSKDNYIGYIASNPSTYPLVWHASLRSNDNRVYFRNLGCRGDVRIYGVVEDQSQWEPGDWFNTGYTQNEVVTLYSQEVGSDETDTGFMFNFDIPLPFDDSTPHSGHSFRMHLGQISGVNTGWGLFGYAFAKHNIPGGFQFY